MKSWITEQSLPAERKKPRPLKSPFGENFVTNDLLTFYTGIATRMSINDCEIIEKFYRKDRWYVKLSSSFNGRATMPHANYVWLKGNPAFVGIPNGYVVHHLDCDKLNDDISNLVIMQKHHHVAHHWKQNKINPDIKVNVEYQRFERTIYVPISEPKIKFDKTRNCYCLLFREESSGEIKRKYLSKLEGKKFSSIEDAEAAKQKIWPPKK